MDLHEFRSAEKYFPIFGKCFSAYVCERDKNFESSVVQEPMNRTSKRLVFSSAMAEIDVWLLCENIWTRDGVVHLFQEHLDR